MPSYSFAREVQTGTVDAYVACTGDFAGGTASNVTVPPGCSKIYMIGVTWGVGATAGAGTCGVRLSGTGMAKEQRILLAAAANDGTAVTMDDVGIVHDVDCSVISGGQITIEVFNGGSDTGTPETGISLLMR